MALQERVTQEDLYLYEILRNPVLCGEFIYNYDLVEGLDEPFTFSWYQRQILSDFNPKVSITTARATGKTVSLTTIILWALVYGLYPGDYILYTVPSKVHLEPVFTNLIRYLRSNSFLKQFIEKNSGINSSDFKITLMNGSTLFCRIAGQSGTGANVIGLHTPMILIDECVTGSQRIQGISKKIFARDLKVGDIVKSWNGNSIEDDVVSSVERLKTNQRVLSIKHEFGSLNIGENHRVYTDDGYIEAKNIKPGDTIYLHLHNNKADFSQVDIDRVKGLVLYGKPIEDIARELGRTVPSVRHILGRRFGGMRNIRDEPLSYITRQVILGTLLGDSSADLRSTKRSCISSNHSIKQREYVDWLVDKLGYLVRATPRVCRNHGWGTLNYSFSTLYHSEIRDLVDVLYKNNKKTVTRGYLDMLEPLSLAVWFMDDGSYSGSLSTHGFSEDENKLIANYFSERWGIRCEVRKDLRKDLYYIQILNIKKFRDLIREHIPECMQYKLDYKLKPTQNIDDSISIIPIDESPSKSLKSSKVLSVSKIRTTPRYLYQITVEKNHNYFCNGVLTKNCGYYPWNTFQELQPSLNVWTTGHRELVAGVPTGVRDRNVLYHADMENNDYTKHRVTAMDNPRITKEDERAALQQYGGVDSDDYIHYFLGKHGKPIFSLFDRSLFNLEPYPVYQLVIDGLKIGDIGEYQQKLAYIPVLQSREHRCIIGIDVGYTEPTAIIIMYINRNGVIKFHARIKLTKVSYPIQEKIIDQLDTKFDPIVIGIDKGNTGIALVQNLVEGKQYALKNFKDRLIPIDFSSWTTLGIDSNGEEIKSRTKPFTVSILQEYSNSHKIMYSSTDLELVAELERMTYTKNAITGDIAYKTLTLRGGKSGEDHFTSALLCGCTAYYLKEEFIINTSNKKRLFNASWA